MISRAAPAAEGRPSRIAVYVEGADSKAVQRDVLGALPDSLSVVDEAKTEAALRAAGLKGHLSDVLSTEDKRRRTAPKLAKVASKLGAGTILVASVPKGKGERDIAVLVVRGKSDVMFDTVTVEPNDGPASKSYKWESFVAGNVTNGADEPKDTAEAKPEPDSKSKEAEPAAKPEAEPAAARDEKKEPERDTGSTPEPGEHAEGAVDRALAVVGVAYDSMTRGFSYNDPVTNNLRPYSVANVPGISASLELYPLARSVGSIVRDIGVTAKMARAFGFESGTTTGQTASTTWQDVEVGLHGRIHTGSAGKAPLLGLGAAYSSSVFDFGSSTPASDLPSARYQMLRGEFDGRVPFGSLAALFEASYLQVLDVSPMSDRFAHESVHGVGARLGVAARALPWLEGRLDLRYDRLFYKMFPEPGDAYVAGGALDQRFSISAGAYAFF